MATIIPITTVEDNPNIYSQGEFLAGTEANFFLSFPDYNGDLFDPSNIDVEVVDRNDTVITSATAIDKLATGYYAWSWNIPSDTAAGAYFLNVLYTAEEEYGPMNYTYREAFVVTEAEASFTSTIALAQRKYLEYLLGVPARVPVFNEVGRPSKDRKIIEFSFPRWNQPSSTKVYLNGSLTNLTYQIDYLKGRVLFDTPILEQDEIRASYAFRWFSDEELDAFIEQGVQTFNQYAPITPYHAWNMPGLYVFTALEQAAVIALRRMMMDLMFQEPAKVFGGMERADKLIGSLDTLKRNYEEEIKELYAEKKKGPYAGLTMTISIPEFTLPGGRSRWFRYLFKGS